MYEFLGSILEAFVENHVANKNTYTNYNGMLEGVKWTLNFLLKLKSSLIHC